jgi:hypothetical protein
MHNLAMNWVRPAWNALQTAPVTSLSSIVSSNPLITAGVLLGLGGGAMYVRRPRPALRKPGQSCLHSLPNEILYKITDDLDRKSLASLALSSAELHAPVQSELDGSKQVDIEKLVAQRDKAFSTYIESRNISSGMPTRAEQLIRDGKPVTTEDAAQLKPLYAACGAHETLMRRHGAEAHLMPEAMARLLQDHCIKTWDPQPISGLRPGFHLAGTVIREHATYQKLQSSPLFASLYRRSFPMPVRAPGSLAGPGRFKWLQMPDWVKWVLSTRWDRSASSAAARGTTSQMPGTVVRSIQPSAKHRTPDAGPGRA